MTTAIKNTIKKYTELYNNPLSDSLKSDKYQYNHTSKLLSENFHQNYIIGFIIAIPIGIMINTITVLNNGFFLILSLLSLLLLISFLSHTKFDYLSYKKYGFIPQYETTSKILLTSLSIIVFYVSTNLYTIKTQHVIENPTLEYIKIYIYVLLGGIIFYTLFYNSKYNFKLENIRNISFKTNYLSFTSSYAFHLLISSSILYFVYIQSPSNILNISQLFTIYITIIIMSTLICIYFSINDMLIDMSLIFNEGTLYSSKNFDISFDGIFYSNDIKISDL